MNQHIKPVFESIVLEVATEIEENGLQSALASFSDRIKNIQSGSISYFNFSTSDHNILVTKLEKEFQLLASGEKISTNFRFSRELSYKLKKLARDAGLDATKVLEHLIIQTTSIKIHNQQKTCKTKPVIT